MSTLVNFYQLQSAHIHPWEMKQVVSEMHQHNQSAAQLGFTSLTNENVNNTPAAAWRECYAINVSHAFFPVDLQVINWFLWLLNKQKKKKEIIKLLSHNYCMLVLLLHAVSCGHTASLIEITATHTNLAGLSELWQVTRAATGWSPGDSVPYLRLCLGMKDHLGSHHSRNKIHKPTESQMIRSLTVTYIVAEANILRMRGLWNFGPLWYGCFK